MRFYFLFLILILTACGEPEDKPDQLVLVPAGFESLPEWEKDNLAEAMPALKKSCERILRRDPAEGFGPLEEAGTYGDWQQPCALFLGRESWGAEDFRIFLETHFQPYRLQNHEDPYGLFTGYYEAGLRGSREKQGPYNIPLHSRPDDLVMVQLGDFREELKGQRIAGRVEGGNLKPYETRAQITSGDWPHEDKVLVWVDDPVDAFFVQIQGSGVVTLPDGQEMRIGYAGQNGHIYYAIGRELIKRGHLTKESVSMQAIRKWLSENPAQADEIMNTNRSYVFFQELTGEGPIGGEGVALTAGRSLAIDRSLLPYGMPVWVDIEPAVEGAPPLKQLMIAQDTGGAIRGPVRGDVFWGYGEEAEFLAGHMKSKGRYWVFLPKRERAQ